jgi:Fic family protein
MLSLMQWIWQHKNWPNFEYDPGKLNDFEIEFQLNSGKIIGAIQHLEENNKETLKIEILAQEAISTSSIEGEILNRDSVQSSIRRHLGLKTDYRKVQPNEAGISEMMVDLYLNFDQPLSHYVLFEWHKMLMNGRRDIEAIGDYRAHLEPMQIVSGNLDAPRVYYEAPPSASIPAEMDRFLDWYTTNLLDRQNMPTLVFAGITHLYFEMIHPFEDGNGRIGRALVEKAISQRLKAPALNSFAKVIDGNKKAYYQAIQGCNNRIHIDAYLAYFANLTLQSQDYSIRMVYFLIEKTKFFAKHQQFLNERQEKVLLRVFDAGIEGFKGGLSASNYKTISGASPATVTRDLQDLVQIGALNKTGELKSTRYSLNLNT